MTPTTTTTFEDRTTRPWHLVAPRKATVMASPVAPPPPLEDAPLPFDVPFVVGMEMAFLGCAILTYLFV